MGNDGLKRACLEAEELVNTEGPEQAKAALTALADASPTRPEPRLSLAKLHRWLGLRDMHKTVDRAQLFGARRLLLVAVELESPPDSQTLTLLGDITHDLALHEEQVRYFTDLAQRDFRPRVRFDSLSWASVALECRGKELAPEGKLAAAAACVRRFCLECLGATSGRAAFDCGSEACPLRPASPFLGKATPLTMRTDDCDGEPARVLRRRPSKALIHAQCRQCQPGDHSDCEAEESALYPCRPWSGPGHAPRRRASPAQAAAAARDRETMRQRASTAVGAAFDA